MHCLDTLTNVWKAVVPQNPAKGPMRKSRSGMVHFKINREEYLCVFGGTGLLCSANHTEATYIPWRENPDWGWTNEVHYLALNNGMYLHNKLLILDCMLRTCYVCVDLVMHNHE